VDSTVVSLSDVKFECQRKCEVLNFLNRYNTQLVQNIKGKKDVKPSKRIYGIIRKQMDLQIHQVPTAISKPNLRVLYFPVLLTLKVYYVTNLQETVLCQSEFKSR
jgi:hypothetical protein